MIKAEAALPADKRMDFVSIVTPNHMHFPPAKMALENGFPVICDKPLCFNMKEALALEKLVQKTGLVFALTHNYTGYPMVKQARQMIKNGELGAIRKIIVEYPQGWLSRLSEREGNAQAAWRTDPKKNGRGGSIGDIGTHAFNLANYITGLSLDSLAADLQSFVPGRRVDDNAHVLMRYEGGARGVLWCSQVASGQENGLRIRVYGEKAGLEWHQENLNYLYLTPLGKPPYRISRGGAGAGEAAARVTRIPPGHPEGYLEGFANIYAEAARAIIARREGRALDPMVSFPGLKEGLEGVAFVDACVRSSKRNAAWVKLAV